MRRSFGGGGSRGMGGGSSGTGGSIQMLRSVQRAVRTGGVVGGGSQEPFSHSTTTTTTAKQARRGGGHGSFKNKSSGGTSTNGLTISSSSVSSPFPPVNLPISATSSAPAWPSSSSPTYTDESDWEFVDGVEDDRPNAFFDDFVFGSVPSRDEVQHAVFSLQGVLEPASSAYGMKDRSAYDLDKDIADKGSSPTGFAPRVTPFGTNLDWMEPSMQLCRSNMLQPHGYDRVYDAFHMLQHEPSVQRMVISLSSDRAVWDAVLNNEVVRELRESLNQADDSSSEEPDKACEASESGDLLKWFVTNVKAKIKELINTVTKIVNELFHHEGSAEAAEGSADALEEKLRTSFMLSIVVLLIVVLNRLDKA